MRNQEIGNEELAGLSKFTNKSDLASPNHFFHPGEAESGGFFADGFRHEGVVAGGFEVVGGLAL